MFSSFIVLLQSSFLVDFSALSVRSVVFPFQFFSLSISLRLFDRLKCLDRTSSTDNRLCIIPASLFHRLVLSAQRICLVWPLANHRKARSQHRLMFGSSSSSQHKIDLNRSYFNHSHARQACSKHLERFPSLVSKLRTCLKSVGPSIALQGQSMQADGWSAQRKCQTV